MVRLPAAIGSSSSALLVFFVVVGVLAPTTAVYWFMNEAVRTQAETARRSVTDAYRGQLGLLRGRLEENWEARTVALDDIGTATSADAMRLRRTSGADAVILFDQAGEPLYPEPPHMPDPGARRETAESIAASSLEMQPGQLAAAASAWASAAVAEKNPSRAAAAAQGQIRCLIRIGDKARALRAIRRWFYSGALMHARDVSGRLVAADEQILALRVMKPADPEFLPAALHAADLLNDYKDVNMPSSQRLFLMGELKQLAPEVVTFPGAGAERLAIQYVEAAKPSRASVGIQRTRSTMYGNSYHPALMPSLCTVHPRFNRSRIA